MAAKGLFLDFLKKLIVLFKGFELLGVLKVFMLVNVVLSFPSDLKIG